MSAQHRIDVEALFHTHARRAFALAFQVTGCIHLAEDVVQRSFLAVHRNAGSFRGDAAPSTWLYRIVVREAVRARAIRGREHRRAQDSGVRDAPATDSALPIDVLAAQERSSRIMEAMDQLSDEQRLALVLLQVQDLAASDIAEMLGVPVNTVYTRAFHARRRLRELLAAEAPGYRGAPDGSFPPPTTS